MKITITCTERGNAAMEHLDDYDLAEWLLTQAKERYDAGRVEEDGEIILRDDNGNTVGNVWITIDD